MVAPCVVAFLAAGAGAAQAQQGASRNPFSSALSSIGLLPPDPAPMPDFVTRTRPPDADLHYLPTGAARPEPATKPLAPDEIRAQEAELSNLRTRDDLRAGRRPPAVKARSAAGTPKVAKKKPQSACRITCVIVTKIGHDDSMR